jgi:hypothetical protein
MCHKVQLIVIIRYKIFTAVVIVVVLLLVVFLVVVVVWFLSHWNEWERIFKMYCEFQFITDVGL